MKLLQLCTPTGIDSIFQITGCHCLIYLFIRCFVSQFGLYRRGFRSSEEPLGLCCSLQRADGGGARLWLGRLWRKFRRKCCSRGLTHQLPVREHIHWFRKTVAKKFQKERFDSKRCLQIKIECFGNYLAGLWVRTLVVLLVTLEHCVAL